MKKRNIGLIMTGLCLIFGAQSAGAVESLCAEVQIDIQQEATLVRQGFDAHMRINNGLPSISLTNVSVQVLITDATNGVITTTSETANTNAAFFVRVDYTENIGLPVADAVSNGTVAASTSADLHWLIIPTPNAGVSNQAGRVFYVGAKLSYTIDGKKEELNVTPDSIIVKPLPELALDYFLPETVYGDDPMSAAKEEVVPFSLGVLLRNTGSGTAKNMKITSGQPKIVENTNGLLVGFTIIGTEVNGKSADNSLLVDFGTVYPGKTALARWTMECSLFGKFTEFSADFTHADELGGMVTSLIQSNNIQTHTLLRDVKVDLPGRDGIRDFLTVDMKLYESDGATANVTNVSATATMTGGTVSNLPPGLSGPFYFRAANQSLNTQTLNRVVRSDGKQLNTANTWISKSREKATNAWNYAFNLFDVNPPFGSSYQAYFDATVISNNAPVWMPAGGKIAYVGRALQFAVHATDSDGTIPSLSAGGTNFNDFGNGYGYFSWTPDAAGTTVVTFIAADEYTNSTMSVSIAVRDWNIPTNCPAWWYDYDVIMTNVAANDFAPVNQGQLKNIAWAAYKEMEKIYGGTNGTGGALFVLTATNNVYNYLPVNIGQAKEIARPFYARLGLTFPYSTNNVQTNDFAMANIGQIKNLFSFDPTKDSDDDGLPDWWETLYHGSTNREVYFNNIEPEVGGGQ